MKLFLIKITLFFLPLLVASICSEILLRNIPNEYLYKKQYLDKNSKNIQVLCLGSSHAYFGINPEFITCRCFNASHVSQTLRYDFEIVKKYMTKWDSLKVIVVPIDYFSLYINLETGIESWRVKYYTIYYGMHTSNNITDYSEFLSSSLAVSKLRLISYYLQHNDPITITPLGWGTVDHFSDKQDLTTSAETAAQRHLAKNDKFFKENTQTLIALVQFAKTKNIKIIFYTSPAFKTYVDLLDSSQLHKTISEITEITRLNSNAFYFNLLTDNSFNSDDFYDADHLDEIGAKKLSLKMDSLIHVIEKK